MKLTFKRACIAASVAWMLYFGGTIINVWYTFRDVSTPSYAPSDVAHLLAWLFGPPVVLFATTYAVRRLLSYRGHHHREHPTT